jgi:hypothetical protein
MHSDGRVSASSTTTFFAISNVPCIELVNNSLTQKTKILCIELFHDLCCACHRSNHRFIASSPPSAEQETDLTTTYELQSDRNNPIHSLVFNNYSPSQWPHP